MVLGFAAFLIFDSRTDAALTALVVLAAILLVIGLIGHRLRSIRYRDTELQLVGGLLVDQAVRAREEGREERAEALAEAASTLDPRLEEFARLRTASDYEDLVVDVLMGVFDEVQATRQIRIGRTRSYLDALLETEGIRVGLEVWAGPSVLSLRRKTHALMTALSRSPPEFVDGLLFVSAEDVHADQERVTSQFLTQAGVPTRIVMWRPGEPRDVLRDAFMGLRDEIQTLRESPPPSESN
jgi:hypothetical protein